MSIYVRESKHSSENYRKKVFIVTRDSVTRFYKGGVSGFTRYYKVGIKSILHARYYADIAQFRIYSFYANIAHSTVERTNKSLYHVTFK
jgi:hypothetical protein